MKKSIKNNKVAGRIVIPGKRIEMAILALILQNKI